MTLQEIHDLTGRLLKSGRSGTEPVLLEDGVGLFLDVTGTDDEFVHEIEDGGMFAMSETIAAIVIRTDAHSSYSSTPGPF